jgi:hypothetical protein
MEALIARAGETDVPESIIEKLNEKDAFKKAKINAQGHLEKALEIAQGLPSSQFTEEIVQMFSSMDNRGN